MWLRAADGGPGLTLGPDGQFIEAGASVTPGPVPAPGPAPTPTAGTDFTAAAGIWAPEGPPEDHAAACYEGPAVLHPDGRMFVFSEGLDAGGLPVADDDHLVCTSMQEVQGPDARRVPRPLHARRRPVAGAARPRHLGRLRRRAGLPHAVALRSDGVVGA